ncbi:hypothetical protein P9B03_09810 [Metasolibacillus meyeri]|uniref:DUF4083 domain-containing protein n=1 Tax=Metasolibacillus meyeri TaxID=1071052 RepID=A0AAW9NMS5_9BACL|nr:hypothetical protein [Metasolibacillus meyeri]MEC1178777.1 hypothetical protein [Metasolibacillus meyeri]
MNFVVTFGDFIATILYLLFWIMILIIIITIFKKIKSFSKRHKEMNEKLNIIIKLLEDNK